MYFFKHKNYLSLITGIIILLLFSPLRVEAQPNWPVIQTAENHTIIVKVDIGATIDGNPLEVGDYVGVFYEDHDTLACGGKAEWTGVNFAFGVYGDDGSTTNVKDGFEVDEVFKWKIWQASTNTEFEATATYKPAEGIISHQGTFAINGISSVESLSATSDPVGSEPDWPVEVTGSNHTVFIPDTIDFDLIGENLEVGDYIGAFFDDNGVQVCAGSQQWTGSSTVIAVFGDDDPNDGVKNGFDLGETFNWKIWHAATETEVDVEADYLPLGDLITHQSEFAVNGISGLESLSSQPVVSGPDWEVIPTIENHSIIVPASVRSSIAGAPFQSGDYFGAFYINGAGEEKCAGYGVWDGNDLVFSVYGTDQRFASAKNGYAQGEEFVWKVYKSSSGQTVDLALVTYIPVGGIYSHTNTYANNGISGVTGIFTSIEQHTIRINAGWNMISSHIDPIQPTMEQVFSQSEESIFFVKNAMGNAYIPALGINQIGDWNYLNGYLVKASSDTSVSLYGTAVDPTTPLEIPAGWSIMPYLSNNDRPLTEVLASIIPFINEMKDIEGNSFIPFWDINQIGDLEPGKAYKIFLTSPQTLIPPPISERRAPDSWQKPTLKPSTFVQAKRGSFYNATLAIPASVAKELMQEGDEIGIFNSKGILAGASVFEGKNMAINLMGDEPETDEIEGFANGEKFTAKIWNSRTEGTRQVQFDLENRETAYQQDELLLARSITLVSEWDLRILDNPSREVIRLGIHTPKESPVRIEIRNQLGQVVKLWETPKNTGSREIVLPANQFATGIYYIKMIGNSKSLTKKLLLMK